MRIIVATSVGRIEILERAIIDTLSENPMYSVTTPRPRRLEVTNLPSFSLPSKVLLNLILNYLSLSVPSISWK